MEVSYNQGFSVYNIAYSSLLAELSYPLII
nr:MAG TPA: hypothetical protein [Caudoviricetes sp.]